MVHAQYVLSNFFSFSSSWLFDVMLLACKFLFTMLGTDGINGATSSGIIVLGTIQVR